MNHNIMIKEVETLIKRAANTDDPKDSVHLSQAALNVAHAINMFPNIETINEQK